MARGEATSIGRVIQFGVKEANPQGLASDGTDLFMVGRKTKALYKLDITSGGVKLDNNRRSKIGAAENFGVNETDPVGLAWHSNELYMIGALNRALYTVNRTTGVATRVGPATNIQFGISENIPRGLASHNSTLYMVGATNKSLYTVDADTGVAKKAFNGFGVGETSPQGLAHSSTTLYMVGATNKALYTVDTTAGVATRVGSATNFGSVEEREPRGLAEVNNTLYMVGATNKALYTVDTTEGVATRVGSATNFGSVEEREPRGLAEVNNTLWMVGATNKALYTMDTTAGVATRVGSATNFGLELGNTQNVSPYGLTYLKRKLYMLASITDSTEGVPAQTALYELNLNEGTATKIGAASQFGTEEVNPRGLASNETNLFMVGFNNSDSADTRTNFYSLNENTGIAIKIDVEKFGVEEDEPYGLAFHNDILYMVGATNKALYTVNTTTGVATRVGSATNFGSVAEEEPRGLTSHSYTNNGNTITNLYMVGESKDDLYTIDTTTGVATSTKSAEGFGVNENVPRGLEKIGTTLYMIGGKTAALYTIDKDEASPNAGIAMRRGSATNFGIPELKDPRDIAAMDSTTMYLIDAATAALYTVNTRDGVATPVGPVENFGVKESTPSGLAYLDSKLYMIGSDTNKLYTINTSDGVATPVGSVENFGVGENDPRGMTSMSNALYMLGGKNNTLYTLEHDTLSQGKATKYSNTEEFGAEETSPQGLAAIGNVLYMIGAKNSALYTIDIDTADSVDLNLSGLQDVKNGDFEIRADFDADSQKITEFTSADISIELKNGTNGALPKTARIESKDITVSDLSGDNNSFRLSFKPANNIYGVYVIGKTASAKIKISGTERNIGILSGDGGGANDIIIATTAITGQSGSTEGSVFQHTGSIWTERGDLSDISSVPSSITDITVGASVSGTGDADDVHVFSEQGGTGDNSDTNNAAKGSVWTSNGLTWTHRGNLTDISEISTLGDVALGTELPMLEFEINTL